MKTWRLKLINQREELVYWREAFRGYDRAVATVMPYGIEIKGRQMSFDKEATTIYPWHVVEYFLYEDELE